MQSVLVTDTHKPLGLNLVKAFAQMGLNVIAAPSGEPEDGSRKNPYDVFRKKPVAVVPWNRSSPLSSKNLILRGLQRFPDLDAALILLPPLPPGSPFADLKYLDVEIVLDHWLKGSILLARDLFGHFADAKGGSLSFVSLSLPKSAGASLLDDLCREAVLVLWKDLLKDARASGIALNVFLSRATDVRAYAEFVAKTSAEKCNKPGGRLFSFQWK